MSIAWMRHRDFYPDIPDSDVDFVALDGDTIVGRVMQFEFGPESGVWFWTTVVTRPGPRGGDTNGRVNSRAKLAGAWSRLMSG
jgi:hypothetical protein